MKRLLIITTGMLLGGLVFSCKKKNDKPDCSSFDRDAFLIRMADSLIIPNYAELQNKSIDFKTAVESYSNSPNTATLNTAKTEWIELYTQWQHCKMYDFGPAMDNSLLRRLSSFPVDTVKIEDNITTGTYNLDLSDQVFSQGLCAFDYLFYHKNEADVIAETDANRSTYLNDLASIINDKINATNTAWVTYRGEFIAANGNDASSSTSFLVNEMNKDFERIKNLKFGFPLGVNVLQIAQPQYIEAKYSKISFDLGKENTMGIKNMWQGRSFDGYNGTGFDDYLVSFGANGTTIKTNTENDFNALIDYYDNYSSDMKTEIEGNYSTVYSHYEEYASMVFHLKSELPSTISILITYQDNDGD